MAESCTTAIAVAAAPDAAPRRARALRLPHSAATVAIAAVRPTTIVYALAVLGAAALVAQRVRGPRQRDPLADPHRTV